MLKIQPFLVLTMSRLKAVVVLMLFQALFLVCAKKTPKIIEDKKEKCADPNAERRLDNPSCVLTCNKKSLFENPGFCFGKPKLKKACYCKQNFYLDEATNKCVPSEKCTCNTKAFEASRFSNECANTCATRHTLKICSNILYSSCWCKIEYCRNGNGTCVFGELADGQAAS